MKSAPFVPLPDMRAMEGMVAAIGCGGAHFAASEALFHAQDLMYEAFEAQDARRVGLAREALVISPDCADALRTSIAKACRALAIPLWSPHDLRHRRISLLHLRGTPWAVIGAFVGQRDLSTTADTYTHVLVDETELDYAELLAVSA